VLRARLTRADRWALLVLVAVPLLLNVPFALAGHPVLDGDNLTQNYPLRVLSGQLIAHGRLPLWDPGIWSGVPLLAGWNAGAMFPGTWLFAVLPGVAAYELNVVAAGVACGVGFHLFLRRSGCSPLASFLGALVWSETGFVSGQVVHLGLIEGTALAPWILLGIDGLFRSARARSSSGHWICLLGATGGLVVLAGDPRAVSSDAIIAVLYLAARCWRERQALLRVFRDVAIGAALAVATGAVQWLPGLAYLQTSQRSASTLTLFGFYSLGWNDFPLLFMPYLIGGNGNFGMPSYAGQLNLPEVTYGVGTLPLIALFALLPRLLRRRGTTDSVDAESETGPEPSVARAESAAASRGRPGLAGWYVMFVVGLVLTTGTKTPLGHLLVHLPLYGGQRDQNRNAAIADFALAVLLALFVDALANPGGEATSRWRSGARGWWRAVGAVPVVVVAGLVAAMFAFTGPMERWLGVHPIQPNLPASMAAYYGVAVVIALAGLVVLVRRSWRSAEGRRRAAAGVVIADVVLFIAMASYQPVPLSVLAPANPALTAVLAHLPAGSRIAIDDPDQLALSYPPLLTDRLGVNDLVLLHVIDSVQGYGSAVPAAYEAATGTHDVENLLPDAFLGSTYDDLDLGILVVVPEQFGSVLAPGAAIPVPAGPPLALGTSAADRQPAGVARSPYSPAGPWRLGPDGVSWQLPSPTDLPSLTVVFDRRYGPLPSGRLVVALRLADGRSIVSSARAGGSELTMALPIGAERAGGGVLAVTVRAHAVPSPSFEQSVIGAVAVTADAGSAPLALRQPPAGTVRYVLNGLLQGLLTPPHWVYAGRVGPLVLYRDTRARGQAWLEHEGTTDPSGLTAAGSVSVPTTARWQDPVTIVDAPSPSEVVRSEQYSSGWTATLQPITAQGADAPGGATLTRDVHAVGLLQGVAVPAGRYRVTWHYHSARADIGLLLAAAGSAACACFAAAGLVSRRRRLASR
jgi:hypothetical protein